MKKISIIICLLPFINLFAQVNGISGGKLSVPDAGTLPVGTFEFEPSFSVSHSNNFFNEHSQADEMPGYIVSSSLLFRITTGLSDDLEMGSVLPSTMEQIDLGLKYNLVTSEKIKLSLTGGGTLPAGNKFIEDSNKLDGGNYGAAIGAIFSNQISQRMSLDAMFSYKKIFGDYFYHNVIVLGAGLGYNFSESVQGVVELNSFGCYEQNLYSGKFAASTGFTFNVTESLLFVSGVQVDIFGKNEFKNFSYFGAFTISMN